MSFVLVSHVIRHVEASIEVRPPVPFVVVVTSRPSRAPAIVVVVSMITVSVTLRRSFETWIRVRNYRFRVIRGRPSIVITLLRWSVLVPVPSRRSREMSIRRCDFRLGTFPSRGPYGPGRESTGTRSKFVALALASGTQT